MSDVEFTFSGDATSLSDALQQIKQELTKTKEAVSTLTSKFANMYFTVQGAVMAIKTAYSAISNIPAQAARLEDLTTVFAQLQGDAVQAGKLVKDLWQDAANGAVPLEELVNAAKPLATVFGDSASIRDWTNRFADIAAGSGMAADALAKVYSRAMSLGKVDSRAIDGLAKQGIPVYKHLAAVMNTSTEAVQKLAKEGSISADAYSAALRRMTDEGGEYYRVSSQLSNTAAGSWGTLIENINRAAAAIGQPINEAFTPVLQSLAASLEKALPDIQAFATSLIDGLSGVGSIISPIVSALADLVDMLGGAKLVVASVAAGMLMLSANTKQAAASTVSLRGQVATLATSMKGLLGSIGVQFKGMLTSLKSNLSATLVGMRMAWASAWTTMVTVVRTAMVAVKAALVSTGIGLIIVGIGEALGALYNWFMGNSEAAEQAAEAARQFKRELEQFEKQSAKVVTWEQYDAFINSINEKIEELRAARSEAYEKEDWGTGEQLTAQLNALWEKKAAYKETLPLQIEEARQAALAAENLKKQREEAEELAKKIEDAKEKLADLVQKQRETEREKYLQGLDTETQISLRLSDAGAFKTLDDLRAEMKRLEESGDFELGDDVRYQKLAKVYNTIIDLKEKAAEATKKEAEETKKKNEEEAKKKAETDASQANYDLTIKMLQAEIQGDTKRLESLKMQQRIIELTAEYQRQGLADAEACAKRMAQMEKQAEQMKELYQQVEQSRSRASAQRYSSSTASFGGGGQSVLVGGPMVTEAKKHTKLLEQVNAGVQKTPTVKVSGNVEAVISR